MHLTKYYLSGGKITTIPGGDEVEAINWLHAKQLFGFPLSPLQEGLLRAQLEKVESNAGPETSTTPTKEST